MSQMGNDASRKADKRAAREHAAVLNVIRRQAADIETIRRAKLASLGVKVIASEASPAPLLAVRNPGERPSLTPVTHARQRAARGF